MSDFYDSAGMVEASVWLFKSHAQREIARRHEEVSRRRAMIRLVVSNPVEPVP